MKRAPTDRGLTCRRCGCKELRVVYTRRRVGGVQVRRRECRRCFERVTTWERAIGMANGGVFNSALSLDGA
jgi:transcriptional regulator NrdR family protein